ncbi:MAG TPA: hypothetical protein VIG24_01250 [Acidimicrobiia bacterium]
MTQPALAENVRGKGRHYRHPVTGDLVPSVTNVISTLSKGEALTRWAAKMVAERAMVMKHSLPRMEDNDIVDTLKSAPFNRSKRAADRGTDIHTYLEHRLNLWEPQPLSDDAMPFKAAADDWYENNYPDEVVATELTMFHPLYAGTTDVVMRSGGKTIIADFKTSKGIYDEAALQLSALAACLVDANGDPLPWRYEDGSLVEMPTLVVIRIGEDGWEEKVVADPLASIDAFFGLLAAWNWKHEKAYL